MNRNLLGLGALALATVIGCSGAEIEPNEDFTGLDGVDEKSDQFSARLRNLGSLEYGDTSKPVHYSNPPKYRSYTFIGDIGDQVDITVSSENGDPIAYLVDARYRTLTRTTAHHASGVAHLAKTLPANDTAEIKLYRIIFAEHDFQNATFTVALKGQKAAPDFTSCHRDSDCVAVSAGGCCPSGRKTAVHKSSAAAYADSVKCPRPPALCPLFLIYDTRVAECNASKGQCEMVEVADIWCGGYTLNPHGCPSGTECQLPTRVEDASGRCVAPGKKMSCNDSTGSHPCPVSMTCTDVASDGCDPSKDSLCDMFCK